MAPCCVVLRAPPPAAGWHKSIVFYVCRRVFFTAVERRRLIGVAVKFLFDVLQGLPGCVSREVPSIVDYVLGLCSGLAGTALLCYEPQSQD